MPTDDTGRVESFPADLDHRERVYKEVLRTVRKAGDTRPGMAATSLWQNRTHADRDMAQVRKAVEAARANDDLVTIRDPDGSKRYVLAEGDALREAVAYLAEQPNPDREAIARLNQRIAAINAD